MKRDGAGLRSAFCGVWLLAIAVPPEKGVEVGGSYGGGRYRVSSCASTKPTVYSETTYAANVRYRAENGVTIAADASGSTADSSDNPGASRHGYFAAGRVGWHGSYFGLEGGAAAYDNDDRTRAVPSALIWGGLPEIHAFGTLFANRYALDIGDFAMGVGHTSRWFAVSAGGSLQGMMLDLEVRPVPAIAPTVSVRFQGTDDWNVAAGITFRFGGSRSSDESSPQ